MTGQQTPTQRRTAVILQPAYLPWLGFFDQMVKSDIFVLYNDVEYSKNSWRNRNRIRTAQGWQWLTVPVQYSGRSHALIKDMLIDNRSNWARKHLAAIQMNYSKAPYFDQYIQGLRQIYEREWIFLIDLDLALMYYLLDQLGIEREIRVSSDLKVAGGKIDRLIAICEHVGATRFLEGDAGENYIDEDLTREAGIELIYHHYKHPTYRQLYGEFIPYLSIIDLLFNHGSESLDILVDLKDGSKEQL